MNIYSFDKLVDERLEDDKGLAINKGVATAIKRKRQEKNFTQGEVSKGICSISYLSKIENGYLEVDNYYVQEIINRIGIDINEICDKHYIHEIKELVRAIYLEEDQTILNIYERILNDNPKNCLSAELISLGKHLYFGEYIHSSKLIKDVNSVKKDLNNYELKVFMYFIALYEGKHMRTKSSMSYLNTLCKMENDDNNLRSLIDILQIRINIYLGEYVLALNTINAIESIIANGININKTIRIKLLQSELLILSGKPKASENILSKVRVYQSMSKYILEYYNYVNGLYLKELGNYEEAITMFLNGCNYYYFQCMSNIVECYFELGNMEMISTYIKMMNEKQIDDGNVFYEAIAHYFKLKSQGNLYELKDYISRQMLPMFKKLKFRYYQEKVMYDLINFHSMNGRYKEINNIREKFNNDF
ncbi:helix-turn-helix transcriptional regulator [Mycoplasmatota bacterium WC44]